MMLQRESSSADDDDDDSLGKCSNLLLALNSISEGKSAQYNLAFVAVMIQLWPPLISACFYREGTTRVTRAVDLLPSQPANGLRASRGEIFRSFNIN